MNQQAVRRVIFGFGGIVILIGVIVALGWIYNIPEFKSILPGQTEMKFNSSIAMCSCGLALVLLSFKRNVILRFLIIFICLIPFLIAIASLTEYLLQLDLSLDQLLMKDSGNSINLGRMSPTVAFCFITITSAILIYTQSYFGFMKKPIVGALAATTIIVSGLLLISFIPNILLGEKIFHYAKMGLHTSVAFILLGSAVLLLIKTEENFTWSLTRVVTINTTIWIFSLLIISSIYFNFITRIQVEEDKIKGIQNSINALSQITSSIIFFDINEKNNPNTPQFIETRIKYTNNIQQNLSDINEFFSNNRNQIVRLNQLQTLLQKKFERLTFGSSDSLQVFTVLNLMLEDAKQSYRQQGAQLEIISSQVVLLSPLGLLLSILIFCIGLFMVNANVNVQKKMEARHEQLAEIVSSSNDAIIGRDLQSNIISWNAGAEQIFGYSASEVVGKSINELIPKDRLQEEEDIIHKIKNGIKIGHFETLRTRKDGKPIYVSVTFSPIKNERNEIIGASKIVRDITEMKQMELQLRQGQKMRAIGELAGGIAHDFNNLLGVILGNLDLLERKLADNEDACKRVQNALKAASRGADLTKRLLAFSRMQQLTPVEVALEDSIKSLVEMASRTIGNQVKITTELEEQLPHIFIDATEFESALLNLLVNARDAMPNGGSIIIAARSLNLSNNALAVHAGELKPGSYVCVSVTDNGTGIPPEILERVFEPFFTTKPRGKGTGMGMAMVYGFIKQSGGIVKIYTELGHGTTITLYMPVAAHSKIMAKLNEPIEDVQISGKALAVDDELELLEITALYLKEMGFDVLHATDGKSALEIFSQHPDIKILVTDIMMPGGMNGLELAKKIRQLKDDIAIVYTSGFPAGNISKSGPLHMDELLLNKPYNRDNFISTVRYAMSSKTSK